ncbi:ABC transporter ATP-binding protein [Paracoccus aurantiacus]|uniref:ABC transporter ATP-binding protein n=1 Tax=Paracoccus aurantiacus TaxID=2599412 RepID=A0A5C6S5C5_9RHOB|nr:ABC transporter ATP-binding protein [Paracoccus aurantiacus]TXB69629.1 ABC transporter ATP-binding protein [Paracoccus aurantiacus]
MLDVIDLTAAYGHAQVLHGLSLRLEAGRIHSLLGRNGAGKTTTLRRIMGLLPHQQGRILFAGDEITGWPTPRIARAGIGYVPEGREVFTALTVRENLTLAGRIGSGDWTIDRVMQQFPGLHPRLDAPAAVLSGGEQQMLSVARALMTSPRLLLLDEPSEGLSVQMTAVLRDVLVALRDQGMTILLVEQDVGLATKLADDVTLMSRGRHCWAGTAAEFAQAAGVRRRYLGA